MILYLNNFTKSIFSKIFIFEPKNGVDKVEKLVWNTFILILVSISLIMKKKSKVSGWIYLF